MAPFFRALRLAACIVACAPVALSATSIGFEFTRGVSYSGLDLRGRMDLDPGALWQGHAAYNRTDVAIPGAETLAHQITLGVDHTYTENVDLEGELIYTYDSINHISSYGPSFKAYYTYFWGSNGAAATPSGSLTEDQALDRDIQEALSDGPVSTGAGPEIFSLLFGLDAREYSLPVGGITTTFTNHAGKTRTAETLGSNYTLLQVYPTVGLDLPLGQDLVRPSISASYYFYSHDPTAIADQINQFYSAALAASRANTLASGLLVASWQVGLGVRLPAGMRLSAEYGRQLLVYPREWVDLYAAKLSKAFSRHLKLDVGCSYFIQEGIGQALGSVGLAYRF